MVTGDTQIKKTYLPARMPSKWPYMRPWLSTVFPSRMYPMELNLLDVTPMNRKQTIYSNLVNYNQYSHLSHTNVCIVPDTIFFYPADTAIKILSCVHSLGSWILHRGPAVRRRCKIHDPLENTTRSGWYAGQYNFSHDIIYKYHL